MYDDNKIELENITIIDHYPDTEFNEEDKKRFATSIVSLLTIYEKSNRALKVS